MKLLKDLESVVRMNLEASEEDILSSEDGPYEPANAALDFVMQYHVIIRDMAMAKKGNHHEP